MGKHSYGDIRTIGRSGGKVIIGKYCSIADNVRVFMAHDHNFQNISTYPFGHKNMPITKLMKPPLPGPSRFNLTKNLNVTIGNDVWIGSEAVIFRDVTIGDGAVIGAFSTITKNIPPYSIVVGNSRIIRKRFSEKDIKFLLELKWWNFGDRLVAELAPILCSPNIKLLRKWAIEHGKIAH